MLLAFLLASGDQEFLLAMAGHGAVSGSSYVDNPKVQYRLLLGQISYNLFNQGSGGVESVSEIV